MSVIVDGLVTEFVAIVTRVGALEESEREDFIEKVDAMVDMHVSNNKDFNDGMETLADYFTGDE